MDIEKTLKEKSYTISELLGRHFLADGKRFVLLGDAVEAIEKAHKEGREETKKETIKNEDFIKAWCEDLGDTGLYLLKSTEGDEQIELENPLPEPPKEG